MGRRQRCVVANRRLGHCVLRFASAWTFWSRYGHRFACSTDPHARHPAPAALRRPDVATPPQRRASDDDDDDVDSFLRNVLRELGGGNGGIGASDQAWGGGVIPVGGGADDLAGVGDVGEGGGDGVAESGGGDGAVGSGEVGDVGGGGSSGRSRVEAAPQNTQLLPSGNHNSQRMHVHARTRTHTR